jgi:hypothetical protein
MCLHGGKVKQRQHLHCTQQLKVILRPTVCRPVRLGVRCPSGTRDQFLFLLEIVFRQLQVCYFVASSLTRRRVCNLMLMLVLASAVPRDSRPYFLLSQFWRLPNLEGQVPILISPQEQGGPVIAPGTGYDRCQSQSHITTDGRSVSMSWYRAQLWDF